MAHVSQMKFNPATETFPKSEIVRLIFLLLTFTLLFSAPETPNSCGFMLHKDPKDFGVF